MRQKVLVIVVSTLLGTSSAKAEPLKDFLMSCVYGAAAGGIIGLSTLAFADDPGSKTNNIARGASLGLYAGMAFGIYVINSPSHKNTDMVWVEPSWHQGQIQGAEVKTTLATF